MVLSLYGSLYFFYNLWCDNWFKGCIRRPDIHELVYFIFVAVIHVFTCQISPTSFPAT